MIQSIQTNSLPRYAYRQPLSVIAVASGKGGVGKTSLTVNLAVALAEKGNSVVLMDADLGLGNVDVALGLRPDFTLDDVMQGTHTLQDVLVPGPAGIHIVPAGSGIARLANLTPAQQVQLIREFSNIDMDFDHMLVDIGAGIHSSVINFSGACQELLVVLCDEPASISDAYALIKVLREKRGIKDFRILANQVLDEDHGKQLYLKLTGLASRFLDVRLGYAGTLPNDDYLKRAVKKQQAAVLRYPRSPYALAVRKLADDLHQRPTAEVTSAGLGFFFERLVAQNEKNDNRNAG